MLGHNFRGRRGRGDFTRGRRTPPTPRRAQPRRIAAAWQLSPRPRGRQDTARRGEASPGDSCATGGHKDPATSCQGFLRRIPRARGDIAADWFNRGHTVLQSRCARHGIRAGPFPPDLFPFLSRTYIYIYILISFFRPFYGALTPEINITSKQLFNNCFNTPFLKVISFHQGRGFSFFLLNKVT